MIIMMLMMMIMMIMQQWLSNYHFPVLFTVLETKHYIMLTG